MSQIEVPDWVVRSVAGAMEDWHNNPANETGYNETLKAALSAALGAWVVPVAWGVRYDWEGTGKSEVRDLRFTKDSAEGAAFAAQCSIPPGFPIKVSAQPLYTFRQEKPE
jgi:hypothetical protein